MATVGQCRVVWNFGVLGLLSAVALGCSYAHLVPQWLALLLGGILGGVGGWRRWQHLIPRIARRDRRYERNKIFVDYLHLGEVGITVLAEAPYLVLLLAAGVLGLLWLVPLPRLWWVVLASGTGLAWSSVLLGMALHYEWQHGPLYYQYNNEDWSGAEGLVYQQGTVVHPLQPEGKIQLTGGVLWNAVSLSGEPIPQGQTVEVIRVHGLTLYVDHLPMPDPEASTA